MSVLNIAELTGRTMGEVINEMSNEEFIVHHHAMRARNTRRKANSGSSGQ